MHYRIALLADIHANVWAGEASRTAAELGRSDWAHQIATGRVAGR